MRCPSPSDLDEFVKGRADEVETARIDAHLATCAECRVWVEDSRSDEDILGNVRRALGAMATLDAPGTAGVMEAALGRYRIVRRIGEGGMGVVFEAEQKNPRRTVALKVIKPGLSSNSTVRRFEHEAQILARLHHPGIAQIHEAGTFDQGFGEQPFFAMELVHGVSLARYLTHQQPSLKERLELFVAICDAVHHAHLQGVIHRDLKPANILVTATGQPKVLDFGVARVADEEFQRTTLRTEAGQLVGTLPYMSPEQVGPDPGAVDIRSDVYALGVILYEMLTGKLPLELTGQSVAAGIHVLQHQDPKPLGAHDRSLRGDLETIAAKALEKEPERRYSSAWALAEDVQRFLRDDPISARPPSAFYQLRKFSKRNKGIVLGVAAAFAILVAGVITTTWQMLRAQAAQREVEDEALATRAAIDFLKEVLALASPHNRVAPGEPTALEMVELAAKRVDAELAEHPVVQAGVHHVLGDIYRDLARYNESAEHLYEALEIYEQLYGPRHRKVAYVLTSLGALAGSHGNYKEQGEYARRALDMRDELTSNLSYLVPRSYELLGTSELHLGNLDEAVANLRISLEEFGRIRGEKSEDFAVAMSNLAYALRHAGEIEEAKTLYYSSLALHREVLDDRHPNVAIVLERLAQLHQEEGELERAEAAIREALAINEESFGEDSLPVAVVLRTLGLVLWYRGQRGEGSEHVRRSLEILRPLFGEDHANVVISLNILGWMKRELGLEVEAEALLRESIEIGERIFSDHQILLCRARNLLSALLVETRREPQAIPLLGQVLEHLPRDAFWARSERTNAKLSLLMARAQLGEREAAEKILAELESSGSEDPQLADKIRQAGLWLYMTWGKPELAEKYR